MAKPPEASDTGASYPSVEPTPLARNPWGWIVLALLFALVVRGALSRSYGRDVPSNPTLKAAERSIEYAVSVAEATEGKGMGAQALERSLGDTRATLGKEPGEAAFLRLVIDRELGRKLAPADVKAARSAPAELSPAVALATTESAAKASAGASERFSVRLAAAQARERAGVSRAEARKGLVRPGFIARLGLFLVGLLGASALAVGLWIWYAMNRASGAFRPQGLPSLPMTPAEGDRFALRAALMFAAFLVGSAVIGLLRLPELSALVLQMALLGGIALYALRLPADPKVPHLSRQGLELNMNRFGERATWGVAAAIANIPILLVVTALSNLLLKNAPPPSHPSTDALLHDPGFGTILITFFLASICAPIWEETMFRGLLFQGLAGARLAPVLSALLSSFLFAAIHPQGLAAWPALAGVALMSCALLAQTRSLVPSIVMHATHNALTLAAAIIVGPVMGFFLP